MSPSQIGAMDDGDRKQWNRLCQLASWMTMMIVYRIPQRPCAMASGNFDDPLKGIRTHKQFLEQYPPPGYRP